MRLEFDPDCDYDLIDNLEVNDLFRDNIDRTLLALKRLYMDKLNVIMALIGRAHTVESLPLMTGALGWIIGPFWCSQFLNKR